MKPTGEDSVFESQWKDEMRKRIKLRFQGKKLSEKKVEKYLDAVFHKHMKNPKVKIVNNYREKQTETDLLSLIDEIDRHELIIGGGGVLYFQHGTPGRENYMYDYIITKQRLRGQYKSERKKYEKGTSDYVYYDNLQLLTKIIINALYGCHGYEGFILFNKFLAESITNMGRQIICTAVMVFENFLSGSIQYNTEEEVYQHITNVCGEYDKNIDYSVFHIDNIDNKVFERVMKMCAFNASTAFIDHIKIMIKNMNYGQKVLMYYKNNLYEFSDHPFIHDKLVYVMKNLDSLRKPDISDIKDPTIVDMINELWVFYEEFVLYDYPIYDRVRKAMFTDRHNVIYVDTDSNFLGLNEWVEYVKNDLLGNVYKQGEKEVEFMAVNVLTLFIEKVIDRGLKTLCKHMNTKEKHAALLNMKNEFYNSRMLFVEGTKKRYLSISILQEGKLLKNGEGIIDIKGFDFKKSVTKEYIRQIYSDICENDILRANHIDVEEIYLKILKLKKEIEDSLIKGESRFFKQANVNIIEHYADPYSQPGIKGTYLWNSLCPDYQFELPTDCDIVPIKEMTGPIYDSRRGKSIWSNQSFMLEFAEKYPDAYDRLENDIYNNPNKDIQEMTLTSIAKPKNPEIPIPEWFSFVVDYDKVVLDDLNLIAPVLNSLGLNMLKTNAKDSYVTDIIDL